MTLAFGRGIELRASKEQNPGLPRDMPASLRGVYLLFPTGHFLTVIGHSLLWDLLLRPSPLN